ncbi:MAG: DUF479 domain-containing protein [Verrucomicrobiae bacterium]|nr:DUF479 domain-containing protein [Verrucomicrobiae bacterium]
MNFLAHLHLARPEPVSRLGNLLGDFVRGRRDERFSPEIWRGIMHHRRLDAFTDSHPAWKRSRQRLAPERVRFAGIVVDVFYDHFLSRLWDRFEPDGESLADFIDHCHCDLKMAAPLGPADANVVIARMEAQGWLGSYGEISGIDDALRRISRRGPRLGPIAGAIADLERDYAGFEEDFLAFYPEAREESEALHLAAEALEETESVL